MIPNALLLALTLAALPQDRSALDARPAGVPLPEVPGIERSEPYVAPAGGTLERDGAVADRFTAAGQRTSYAFDARAGELSIFELATTGYARGWTAACALRVVDAEGRVLCASARAGEAQFRVLLAFLAERDGRYTLEVEPTSEYFRYQLVRHSGYASHAATGGAIEVDGRERVHTWLGRAPSVVRMRVPVHAGEELVVRVEGTREEAREERRRARDIDLAGGPEAVMAMGGRRMRMLASGRAPAAVFAGARLALAPRSDVVHESPTLVRVDPASDGWLDLALVAEDDQVALVDLVVERAPERVEVSGALIDADDEGLAGVPLEFLLEPDLDVWARVTTGDDGAWSARLPLGDWRVRLPANDGPPTVLRMGITGPARDLVLLVP